MFRSSLTRRRACWTRPEINWAITLNCGSSEPALGDQRRASGRQRLERAEPKPRAVFQAGSTQLIEWIGYTHFIRQQDLQGAIRLWSRLAEQEPNDLELRLNLLDLAFQTANSDEIDKNIKQIGQIEGNEGFLGRYCQVRYLIWQAERAGGKDPQEALRLRTEARVLLNELASRRPNWSVIPLALAQLEQQELRQGGLTDR